MVTSINPFKAGKGSTVMVMVPAPEQFATADVMVYVVVFAGDAVTDASPVLLKPDDGAQV